MSAINVYVDGAEDDRKRRRAKRAAVIVFGVAGAFALSRPKPAAPPIPTPVPTPVPIVIASTTAVEIGPPPADALPPTPANAVVAPGKLDFGERPLDSPGSAQLVTIRNDGGVALPRATTQITAPFLVTNGCSDPLAPGASCVAAVVFAPRVPGRYSGELTIVAGNDRRTIPLSGRVPLPKVVPTPTPIPTPAATAVPPPPPPPPPPPAIVRELCVSPAEMHFTRMGRKNATITNPNDAPLRVAEITALRDDGRPGQGYIVEKDACRKTLDPNERCTFFVQANAFALFRKERIRIQVTYEDPRTGGVRIPRATDDCSGGRR
jgi:hypothetical protein